MIERRTAACAVDPSTRYEDDALNEEKRASGGCKQGDGYASAAVTELIDGVLADFVRSTQKDDILHIGMNRSSAKAEVDVLSKNANVTSLAHGRDGVIQHAGVTYDLNDDAGLDAFGAMLRANGLGWEQSDRILGVIRDTGVTGRDEIANLALLWLAGERGEPVPGRIVLSGHSSGDEVWDERGDGEISFKDVRRLAQAMPRAAAQVEDIHIAGCSTGGQGALENNRQAWLDAFPNMKTLWTYDGAAPRMGGTHLAEWEQATRGAKDSLALTKQRSAESVGVWDRVSGYRDGSAPLAIMRSRQHDADSRFASWLDGTRRPSGSEDPALVSDYRTYRALSHRSDLQPAEREVFRVKAEQLLRLRYFDGAVRKQIDREFGATIAKAFKAVGLPAPKIASLSYRETVAQIEAFEKACAARGMTANEELAGARAILADIRALDWARIPSRWCTH